MKTIGKPRRPGALVLLLGVVLLGGAGCNTYKYFDIHVAFDPSMYDISTTQIVTTCHVTVSGAASGSFDLPDGVCPNHAASGDVLDAGTFEFSTFADSGTITFKVDTYTGAGKDPACITGSGSSPVKVTGDATIKGSVQIEKVSTGMVCNGVTAPMDAQVDL